MAIPLWCKSNFSFLEGASRPEELVVEAHRLGLGALALTDRDGVYGVVRAHQKFNTHEWRDELARRHQRIDRGDSVDLDSIERLIRQLDTRSA